MRGEASSTGWGGQASCLSLPGQKAPTATWREESPEGRAPQLLSPWTASLPAHSSASAAEISWAFLIISGHRGPVGIQSKCLPLFSPKFGCISPYKEYCGMETGVPFGKASPLFLVLHFCVF